MRGIRLALAVTTVTALIMSTAPAQQPPGRGKGGGFGAQMFQRGGAIALLTNASVQTELKLTDDQKAKFKEFQDKQEAKMREMRADGGFDREKMQEMFREAAEQGEKLVKDTLKKDQFQRYSEIKLQRAGVGALSEKDVQTSLKLNDDQKEKIKGITDEYNADRRELMQGAAGGGGGNFAELRTKGEALSKEALEKAQKVLTADQKTKFKEMLGKPFEMKVEDMRRPGGDDSPRKGGKGGDRKSTEKKKDDPKTPPKSNPKIDD
jgi:Spy/CpxP family protein refolding chaperone